MATLTIRKLPDSAKAKLRTRAAQAGRSMEAEARNILIAAIEADDDPKSPHELPLLVDDLYGHDERPRDVVDELIAERRRSAVEE